MPNIRSYKEPRVYQAAMHIFELTRRSLLKRKFSTVCISPSLSRFHASLFPVSPRPRVEAYDPVEDIWTEKADMSTARCYLPISVVDGKIYAIGGITGEGAQVFATVEEFTPEVLQPGLVYPQGKLPTKWGAEKGRGDSGTRRQKK